MLDLKVMDFEEQRIVGLVNYRSNGHRFTGSVGNLWCYGPEEHTGECYWIDVEGLWGIGRGHVFHGPTVIKDA